MKDKRIPARAVPTELAALAAGVSEATIRKWASRGKITRYGSPRRACYDLTELLELIARRSNAAPPGAPLPMTRADPRPDDD